MLMVRRISNHSEGLFAPAIAPLDFLQIPALKDVWFLLWEKNGLHDRINFEVHLVLFINQK